MENKHIGISITELNWKYNYEYEMAIPLCYPPKILLLLPKSFLYLFDIKKPREECLQNQPLSVLRKLPPTSSIGAIFEGSGLKICFLIQLPLGRVHYCPWQTKPGHIVLVCGKRVTISWIVEDGHAFLLWIWSTWGGNQGAYHLSGAPVWQERYSWVHVIEWPWQWELVGLEW